MKYEKSEIKKGTYLELDCDVRTHLRAPQYGEPFAEVSAKLDSARLRLEALVKEIRNARRQ